MEREYKLSRIIIVILMMMVSFIMLINEDISVKIFGMILYYIVLLIAFLAAESAICLILYFIFEAIPYSNELGIAAGEAMIAVLIGFSSLILVIIPYFQTLIMLGLRKIITKIET